MSRPAVPTMPLFAKPAAGSEQRSARRGVRVVKVAAKALAAVAAVAVLAAALWAYSLGRSFDEGRNVIDLDGGGTTGNAQPDMEGILGSRTDEDAQRVSHEEPEDPVEEAPAAEGPLNILLLGSDARTDGSVAGARSDTIMVAHIPQDRSSVQIMSLPRDLWVPIPGHGHERINSSFSFGGAGLTMRTVEDLLDIDINHVVMIDFAGFAELTTALGGVTVDNPREFTTTYDDRTFAEGEITLEGKDALSYVRERKVFPEGDFARVANQQRVVRAVMEKLLSADTLANPAKIQSTVDTMLPYLSMDEDLTAARILQYGLQSKDLRAGDITTFTIPGASPFTTSGGAEVLAVDDDQLGELRQAFKDESLPEFAEAHPSP